MSAGISISLLCAFLFHPFCCCLFIYFIISKLIYLLNGQSNQLTCQVYYDWSFLRHVTVLSILFSFFPRDSFVFADVPSPPSGLHVSDIYHDSCVLSWSPPVSDGGLPVSGFHVEQRLLTRPSWLRLTTTPVSGTRYQVSGLMDGQSYQYRVLSENRVGLSEPSAPSATIVAKDPWDKPAAPGPPQITDVTRRSCKLTWLPPTSDGGDDIRTYVVEHKVADAFKWVRANEGERILDTSYRITGLHSELDYVFRVAAENRAGIGPYSEASLPVRALDPKGMTHQSHCH